MKTTNSINIAPASNRASALNKAYRTFRDEIEKYAAQNQISDEEIQTIKDALEKIYHNKKMTYFLEEKTGRFNKYIEDAFNSALGNLEKPESNKEYKSFFYLKHTKQLLTHEKFWKYRKFTWRKRKNTEENSPYEKKVENILEELEYLSLQNSSRGITLADFSPQQKNKLLEIIEKNEDNAFHFHTKRLESIEKISLSKINSSTVNQKTIRWVLLGLLLIFVVLTIVILLFKDNYFIPWLTFLTGIGGGFGLSSVLKSLFKEPDVNANEFNSSEERQ